MQDRVLVVADQVFANVKAQVLRCQEVHRRRILVDLHGGKRCLGWNFQRSQSTRRSWYSCVLRWTQPEKGQDIPHGWEFTSPFPLDKSSELTPFRDQGHVETTSSSYTTLNIEATCLGVGQPEPRCTHPPTQRGGGVVACVKRSQLFVPKPSAQTRVVTSVLNNSPYVNPKLRILNPQLAPPVCRRLRSPCSRRWAWARRNKQLGRAFRSGSALSPPAKHPTLIRFSSYTKFTR